MKIRQQFNAQGQHRLVATLAAPTRVIEGHWASYTNYAELLVGVRRFICVTEFFAGGLMEEGKVYEISEYNPTR